MEDNLGQDGESDEEWFYESITRYEDLLMYDVQGDICCSTFYDTSKVVLGISRESLHELWMLSVPEKLLAGKRSGLVNNRDFNLVAAGYTNGSVKKVARAGTSIVSAEEGGICLYSVPYCHNASDVISLSRTLWQDAGGETVLAVSGDSHVYVGDSLLNLTQLDLSSEKTHKLVVHPTAFQRNEGKISEVQCVGDKLFICMRDKGSVLMYDRRTNLVLQEVQVQGDTSGLWMMDSSKEGDFLALASSCGSVCVLDLRNVNKEIYSYSLENACNSSQKVTVCFSPSGPYLSLSGFDKTVKILNYKCEESDSKIFNHDGHRGKSIQSIVTHLWHPTQKNLLFSADDTGNLNAWRFKQPLTVKKVASR